MKYLRSQWHLSVNKLFEIVIVSIVSYLYACGTNWRTRFAPVRIQIQFRAALMETGNYSTLRNLQFKHVDSKDFP